MKAIVFALALSSTSPLVPPTVTASSPWLRLPPPQAPTAALFLVLENTGDVDRKLVGASVDVAGRAELHTHTMENGVMKMRKVEAVDVKAHAKQALAPGGLHVMLFDLKAPLTDKTVAKLRLKQC